MDQCFHRRRALLDWEAGAGPALDARGRDDILGEVVHAAEEIIRGKGATNYAIGPAGARVVSLAFGLTLGFLLGLIVVPLRSVRLRWASRPVHWWLG